MKDIKEFSQARKTYSRDTPKSRNVEKILLFFWLENSASIVEE
jgi:hypothetical protein